MTLRRFRSPPFCSLITGNTSSKCSFATMPLYELLCLARPHLPKEGLQSMIHKVGSMVYSKGGVITDVQSYGQQNLAYKIKGVHDKFDKAHIWQLNFAVSPQALQDINMEMRVNEDILRWVVVKRDMPNLPSPRTMFHRLSEHAELLTPPRPGQQFIGQS